MNLSRRVMDSVIVLAIAAALAAVVLLVEIVVAAEPPQEYVLVPKHDYEQIVKMLRVCQERRI